MVNDPSANRFGGSSAPESAAPAVSVIIPHYNDLANLGACLRLLAAQTLPRSQFEIVVGDNNSRCGVAEDADWGRRAVAANYRFRYAPDVVVSHPARRTWPELTQKWGKASREAFAATIERPNGRAVWFLRGFAILASPLVHWIAI